jgi:hypothetical protein
LKEKSMALAMAIMGAFAAWIAGVAAVAFVFLGWTGSLFVSLPAALCVATGTALLLASPLRR